MPDITFYTLNEVADALKLTRRTLYTYIKQGKHNDVKIGKYWRVWDADLRAIISRGTQG